MKTFLVLMASVLAFAMTAVPGRAQGTFKVETGKVSEGIVPRDFVLEANAIPTEKRNSVLVLTPSGARMIVGLIDTAGYSTTIQQKYKGMLITEGKVDVCGNPVDVGSYGFGLAKPTGAMNYRGSRFILYNQAGKKLAECSTSWDTKLKVPRPLEVVVKGNGLARLYLGRNWVELK